MLYNFYCEPNHEILIGANRDISTTLGGYCPRIAENDKYTGMIEIEIERTKILISFLFLLFVLSGMIQIEN